MRIGRTPRKEGKTAAVYSAHAVPPIGHTFRFRQTRPTDMARLRIAELFEREPSRWGGRGDPYLWQEMAGQLADAPWPASAAALERLLGETFERLSGHPLEYDALIYLARHAHGGMSSGMVSPEFWRETAIPELLDRYRRRRSWLRWLRR